jgi:hypothetical protein
MVLKAHSRMWCQRLTKLRNCPSSSAMTSEEVHAKGFEPKYLVPK